MGAPYFPPPRTRSAYREPEALPPTAAPEPRAKVVSRPEPPDAPAPKPAVLSIEARMARDHARTSDTANEWALRFVLRFGLALVSLGVITGGTVLLRFVHIDGPMPPWLLFFLVPLVLVGAVGLLVYRVRRLARALRRL